jgi:hypothetical protein
MTLHIYIQYNIYLYIYTHEELQCSENDAKEKREEQDVCARVGRTRGKIQKKKGKAK